MLKEKVEEIKKQNQQFDGVAVGEILEIVEHPNADRLRIVIVNIGAKSISPQLSPYKGEEVLTIVCGAPNIQVGQKVPVATIGTKLSALGGEIKEVEIRGVKSFGMLCAEDELGLSSNHSGIMILNENAEVGMEFEKYINLNK